jgi:hypothetical protein
MRTTIKLNKKIRKNRNHKMSRKMMAGGPSETSETSEEVGKKRGRDSEGAVSKKSKRPETVLITQRVLGNGNPVSDSYGKRKFTKEQITKFVNNMTPGPQIVSLPTDPQSHSIFVNIKKGWVSKVMISDWNGAEPRYLGKLIQKGKKKKTNPWIIYSMLIDELEKNYGNVEYYPVDQAIHTDAAGKHETCNGQGGCSEYMYNWMDKHIIPHGYEAVYETVDTPY